MSAEDTALLGAIESMVANGHTFQIGPGNGTTEWPIYATVSGPSGSRSVAAKDARKAIESLVVQIVEARLNGPA